MPGRAYPILSARDDLGGATGLMASATLTWLGAPLWAALLLGLLGIVSQFVLLRMHYARKPALTPATASRGA